MGKNGFLTAFDEKNNNLRIKKLRLSFLAGVTVLLADLDSGALLPRACLAGWAGDFLALVCLGAGLFEADLPLAGL